MEEALLTIVPRSDRQAYNMRKVIAMIADRDSTFEIQAGFGKAAITMLARLDGYPVGIIANNPMTGGIVDVKAARKQAHFNRTVRLFQHPLSSSSTCRGC
jgi:acetyl-CoA carboxylase carboxyltransferase component